MPTRPRNACPVCRRLGCPGHEPGTKRPRQKSQTQHKVSAKERAYRAAFVKDWVDRHGMVCPGYQRPPHLADRLTADHVHPLHMGGDPMGTLQILCDACNAKRGNDTRWLQARLRTKPGAPRKF